MGWSYGLAMDGKEIGYAVNAGCEHTGCKAKIDRGLAYACGDHHEAGENYCDGYFCYKHLIMTIEGQRCPSCAELISEPNDY